MTCFPALDASHVVKEHDRFAIGEKRVRAAYLAEKLDSRARRAEDSANAPPRWTEPSRACDGRRVVLVRVLTGMSVHRDKRLRTRSQLWARCCVLARIARVANGRTRHVQVEVQAGEADKETHACPDDGNRNVVDAILGREDDDRGTDECGNRV